MAYLRGSTHIWSDGERKHGGQAYTLYSVAPTSPYEADHGGGSLGGVGAELSAAHGSHKKERGEASNPQRATGNPQLETARTAQQP